MLSLKQIKFDTLCPQGLLKILIVTWLGFNYTFCEIVCIIFYILNDRHPDGVMENSQAQEGRGNRGVEKTT